jgi:hypothetical protein
VTIDPQPPATPTVTGAIVRLVGVSKPFGAQTALHTTDHLSGAHAVAPERHAVRVDPGRVAKKVMASL